MEFPLCIIIYICKSNIIYIYIIILYDKCYCIDLIYIYNIIGTVSVLYCCYTHFSAGETYLRQVLPSGGRRAEGNSAGTCSGARMWKLLGQLHFELPSGNLLHSHGKSLINGGFNILVGK